MTINEIAQSLEQVLGLGADELNWYQVSTRALVIYIAALFMVRVGEKRFLGKNTAFDVILGIILGSVVSRAINASASFFVTILAGFILVGVHWLFSYIAFRSDRFGTLIKGSKRQLVQDGEIQWEEMDKSNFSKDDLMSQIRSEANQESLDSIHKAYLERSGNISIIRKQQGPKILEVEVADGVQIVRIQVE
jgi:uncharacterized membrane protein YcaP (DUF421 family)